MVQRAWEFSSTIAGNDLKAMENNFEASNAFKEPDQAKLRLGEPGKL